MVGFTAGLLAPAAERTLLDYSMGVTNLVARTTAAADELTKAEFAAGCRRLKAKAMHYKPRIIAVLEAGADRVAFGRPKATIGSQAESMGSSALWVLPNPSGLNAHYQMKDLVRALREAAAT